jgi:predicted nucleic acid-binding protein
MTLSWFFEDEASPATDALFASLPSASVLVPSLWLLELANALNVAVRRRRTEERRVARFLDVLQQQSISVDSSGPDRALRDLRPLAARHALSVYDAVYLDLAVRTGHPLATLDAALRKAAKAERVSLQLA